MIGTEPTLGVAPADDARLFVLLCPVGPYYATGFKPVNLLCDPSYVVGRGAAASPRWAPTTPRLSGLRRFVKMGYSLTVHLSLSLRLLRSTGASSVSGCLARTTRSRRSEP